MSTIYFISNRNVLAETSVNGNLFGTRFNAAGPQCFRVGSADVTDTGDPMDDRTFAVGKARLFAEKLGGIDDAPTKLGSARFFEELRSLLKAKDREVFVFLHGFNTTFVESLQTAAALQARYSKEDREVLVIVFSWPSNGEAAPSWNYFSDREDAEASGLAMGRALKRLVDFLTDLRSEDAPELLRARRANIPPDPEKLKQCGSRLHILAHSMGNWALRHGLQKFIGLNGGRVLRVFDCVFLMAADEDNDALELDAKLKPLDQLANRVFVYHSRKDGVLAISDSTKGNPSRLGSDGPRNMDTVGARVMAVNCVEVGDTTLGDFGHSYFRRRPEVIRDIQLTLADVAQGGRAGRADIRPGRSWRLLRQP